MATSRAVATAGPGGQTALAVQASPQVSSSGESSPFPNITVLPVGTATNPEGTPVVLPTAHPPSAPSAAAATPGAQATALTVSGTTISVAPPPNAAGDFDVDVKIDGVAKPYLAFNVYVTFDPAILAAIVIKPGAALSPSPDGMFCARAPATAGAVGLGCTVVQGPPAATNGVLATIRFHQVGAGTARLHLRSVAEGAATTGTYTSTPRQGAQPRPDIVTLVDGTVILS